MFEKIQLHLPSLYIVIPLISSLLIIIIGNRVVSRYLFLICNLLLAIIAFNGYFLYEQPFVYSFGGWHQPIGIEFKYNKFAAFCLLILSAISMYYALFSVNIIKGQIEAILKPKRKHLVYAVLLLIHASFGGLILTNDIFNLYVFIEITSLTCCTVLAIGRDPRGVVGAFDYLLIGTIGATMILTGIGLLLSITGTLNIDDLAIILKNNNHNYFSITQAAGSLLILGCLVKLGIMPLHFWQIRAYSYSSPIFASYLVGTSTLVILVVTLKLYISFLQFYLIEQLLLLQTMGILAIIFGSVGAFFQKDLRKMLVFSSIAQLGYYFMLWGYETSSSFNLLISMVIIDCITKMGLFLGIAALQAEPADFSIRSLIGIAGDHKWLTAAFCLLLLNSAGLPLTVNFINKLNFIDLMLNSNQFFIMGTVLGSSFITILYHFKIARQLFKNSEIKIKYKIDKLATMGTLLASVILFIGLFYYNNLGEISLSVFKELHSDF